MTQPSLSDDLAYIRAVAESGRNAPLLGGRFLAWWGGLLGPAYLIHYGLASDRLPLGDMAYLYMWGGFMLIGTAGFFALVRKVSPETPGQASVGAQVEASVWKIAGFVLGAYFVTLFLKAFTGGNAIAGFEHSLALVFSAYAIALFTSGAVVGNRVLKTAGYGALVMIALSAWFAGTAEIWAVAALGVFLTVFLPGVVLMLREPRGAA
ncbi:MAG: hypothetical protein MH112_02875 [Phenylobacterium sp.]|uniref:hypothetical protein n=1 Tax=Phenylobacterium sp. TaxID=1871053 RepID=UPI0025E66DCC|nr:hypothetical protein [Phenylobacterium sp.]MCG9915289.1 hypothetical protein [Phenylobacterium sp.]